MRRLQRLDTTKLDIGCGPRKKEGYAGLDATDYGQELVWDLNHGIPVPDNTITDLRASHVLEHFTPRALRNIFIEIMRVCRNGAILEIIVPASGTPQSCYLGHLSFWNETTIRGICQGTQNSRGPVLILEDVQIVGTSIQTTIKITKED